MIELPLLQHSDRLLIVEDDRMSAMLLEHILRGAGYENVVVSHDPREVLPLCEAQPPDLILLDLMMPHIDGFGVMDLLQSRLRTELYLPVLMLTADISPATKLRALAAGAKDFLTKPFDSKELLLRVRNLLQMRALYSQLQHVNDDLASRVSDRTRKLGEVSGQLALASMELEEAQYEVVQRLCTAAEFRDDQTGAHIRRVGDSAALLARALGLNEERVALIHRAAPLHDVGKIGIPDDVLLKPGHLEPEEFDTIKSHTNIGARLLANGKSPLVQLAETIALTHHERWDGSGYPCGLMGEAIPLEGRILAVVDVFDALTNVRPYKSAWPVREALAEIERCAGHQFDPCVASTFLKMVSDWHRSSNNRPV